MADNDSDKGFYALVSGGVTLNSVLYFFSSKELRALEFGVLMVFLFVCGVYYIAKTTLRDKKQASARKVAPPPVVHVNLFELAINQNETTLFLLGRGSKYYLPVKEDIQLPAMHDPLKSFEHVKGYARRFGNGVALKNFEEAINKALEQDLPEPEARLIVRYVVIYADQCSMPNTPLKNWMISEETQRLMMAQIDKFIPEQGSKAEYADYIHSKFKQD